MGTCSHFSEWNSQKRGAAIAFPSSNLNDHIFRQIWLKIEQDIKSSLYRDIYQDGEQCKLTACPSYNVAYINPSTNALRERLFSSYEQMDNKNNKN